MRRKGLHSHYMTNVILMRSISFVLPPLNSDPPSVSFFWDQTFSLIFFRINYLSVFFQCING